MLSSFSLLLAVISLALYESDAEFQNKGVTSRWWYWSMVSLRIDKVGSLVLNWWIHPDRWTFTPLWISKTFHTLNFDVWNNNLVNSPYQCFFFFLYFVFNVICSPFCAKETKKIFILKKSQNCFKVIQSFTALHFNEHKFNQTHLNGLVQPFFFYLKNI